MDKQDKRAEKAPPCMEIVILSLSVSFKADF
jgi:hypothetical protein